METVLTSGLSKSYGTCHALRGIDLRIPAGALYGFLGPNGAGKSTALRILLGLLRASAGSATVFGLDCWRDGPQLRRRVGYLSGDVRLYPQRSGRGLLAFLDRARGCDSSNEIRRLTRVFELDLTRRVRDYSRGMKQKLGLIQALMHRPELLILDEPTISLDPLVRDTLHAELRRATGEGRTVLFSSHTLSEVEQICDWVGIVRRGALIEQDRVDSLRERALRHVDIMFDKKPPPTESLPDGLHVTDRSDSSLRGGWIGPPTDLFAWLAHQPVRDVIIAPPNLEDLFKAYYENQAQEANR